MNPTVGSLFAGIGGFDLGFERAGFKTIWQCEIDKAAQGVLRRRFPGATLHSDVREVGAHNLEPVDVVTFGSPCQDLSVAGKRAGLAGNRSGLFHEAARIIRELREQHGKPDFAIWENVPGAFSSNGGADFAAVVQAMVDLGARDVCWRVLDSRYFGVAQRRRRVFLVADFGGKRAEQILFEPESLRGDIAKGGKKRKGAPAGIGAGAAGSSRELPAKLSCTLNTAFGETMGLENQHALAGAPMFVPTYWDGGQLADTLDASMAARRQTMPERRRFAAVLEPVPFDTTQITSPSNFFSPKAGDPCHPLAAGAHPPAVAFAQNTRDEVRLMNGDGQIVGALAAQPGMKQTTYVAQPIAFHPTQDPISSQDGISHAMSNGSGAGQATVAVCATGEVTHALTCTAGKGATEDGTGRGVPRAAHLPMQVRRLTPTECEFLQGFPRNWTAEACLPDGTIKQQADGPRYKQLGNAVTVNVAEWIARRIANEWRKNDT